MFTEDELREAFQHSAGRAHVGAEPAAPRRRRRYLLPAAAAAAVLVIAGGAVLLRSGGGDHPKARVSQPAAHLQTSPAPVHRHVPPPVQDPHVPVDISNAVDLVHAGNDFHLYYTLGNGSDTPTDTENLAASLGTRTLLSVDIVPADNAEFDPGRIPRDQPVPIDGTTGYYSNFKLYPLDADTGPGSDKYVPAWTVAWRTAAGDWAFAHVENTKASPAVIAADVAHLRLSFQTGTSRIPVRTGFLPAGMRVASIMIGYGETFLDLRHGDKDIDIDVLHNRAPGQCVDECGAVRTLGSYKLNVSARGYGRDVEQHVLTTLAVASDLGDPSTFFTIPAALG